jgi:hypothetical protein
MCFVRCLDCDSNSEEELSNNKLLKVLATKLRERLQGAQASPLVGDKYNPSIEVEY